MNDGLKIMVATTAFSVGIFYDRAPHDVFKSLVERAEMDSLRDL